MSIVSDRERGRRWGERGEQELIHVGLSRLAGETYSSLDNFKHRGAAGPAVWF